MGDLKTRLSNARTKLLRRTSATSTHTTSTLARSTASSSGGSKKAPTSSSLRRSMSLTKLAEVDIHEDAGNKQPMSKSVELPKNNNDFHRPRSSASAANHRAAAESSSTLTSARDRRSSSLQQQQQHHRSSTASNPPPSVPQKHGHPAVTLEEPTPVRFPAAAPEELTKALPEPSPISIADPSIDIDTDTTSPLRPSTARSNSRPTPPGIARKQSLVTSSDARIIKTLLDSEASPPVGGTAVEDYSAGLAPFNAGMLHRKIWVKRPNASATLVQIKEDDLVDDVRDTILKKYANTLGRVFDAPDVTLRICPRDPAQKSMDRILGPEEEMCRTLDDYYPGGQTVHEALLIEVPHKRTPRPSPRAVQHGIPYYYHPDESRPLENAQEYFPPMPIVHPSPAAMTAASHDSRSSTIHPSHAHSIAVLQTGQIAPLPSPGSTRRGHRPKYPRHNTSSPTALVSGPVPGVAGRPINRPRHDSSASDSKHPPAGNVPIPTPPAPEGVIMRQNSTPPTPRVASPRPGKTRKSKRADAPSLPSGLLDGSVPPINVLIVEDNIINLRVLGAFMQRLKVRWQRAMNGKEAVTKWRAGGFHLVLMDIQLPIMNGLEATKEIRRLERVNSIGVFSSGSIEAPHHKLPAAGTKEREVKEEDKLGDSNLFKSPVIIVALTASSLQSDRHEALAAGCNDFLTKPVNFVWLERKVKEWGCMQALIDYDGWRKWKEYASQSDTTDSAAKLSTSFSIAPRPKKSTPSPTSASNPSAFGSSANGAATGSRPTKELLKERRKSIGPPPVIEEKETPPA